MIRHNISISMFQNYGNIFENISKNETLKNELAEYGYDSEEIAKGKVLYDIAAEKLDINKAETAEEKLAYDQFRKKFEALKKSYTIDRKKVKIIYKNEAATLSVLGVKGTVSIRITEFLDSVDTLYKQLRASEDLLRPLARLKITEEHITAQLEALEEVKTAYNAYTKEKGESQQATKDKDKALAYLEKWVREFYAIAKIALEDQPQLLESVGKFMRS